MMKNCTLSQLKKLSVSLSGNRGVVENDQIIAILSHYLHNQGKTYEMDGAYIVNSIVDKLEIEPYYSYLSEPDTFVGKCSAWKR